MPLRHRRRVGTRRSWQSARCLLLLLLAISLVLCLWMPFVAVAFDSSIVEHIETARSELALSSAVRTDDTTRPRSAAILFWNKVMKFYHREYTIHLPNGARCRFTNKHSALKDSRLVVVHFHGLSWWGNGTGVDPYVPSLHPPGQEWVFYTQEPPTLKRNLNPSVVKLFGQHFNATATYRTDSDIDARYGYYLKRRAPLSEQAMNYNYAANRSQMVAWLVSHCDLYRVKYVVELRQHVQVDIYGGCGKKVDECKSKLQSAVCLRYLSNRYKFLVAFENSDCQDYITEKLWRNALSYDMVPIVRGHRNNYEKLAPPRSYIAAEQFSSPKQLAEYLLLLNHSDNLYNEYFQWKRDFEVYANPMISDLTQRTDDFDVNLCHYAHRSRSASTKWYNIYEEIFNETLCSRG